MSMIYLILFMSIDAIRIRWKHSYIEGMLYVGAMLNIRMFLLLVCVVLERWIEPPLTVSTWYLYISIILSAYEYYMCVIYKRMMAFVRLGYFYMTMNLSGVVYQVILLNTIYYYDPDMISMVLLLMSYPLFFIISRQSLGVIKKELDYAKQNEHKNTLQNELVPIIREIHMVQHEYANILSGFLDVAAEDIMYRRQVTYINRKREQILAGDNGEKDLLFEAYGQKIPMVRNVLLSKSRKIRGLNMDFRLYSDIPVEDLEQIPIQEYDLVTILANLIDNAIEALIDKCKSSESRGIIVVYMSMTDTGMTIKVGNNHDTIDEMQMRQWFRMGYTTKQNSRLHGFGLHIVSSIIHKYSGHYFYEVKKGSWGKYQDIRYICLYFPKQEVTL